MTDFSKLNKQQAQAVRSVDGPVLILAGAGSGKTTVLVNRIGFMIEECGINPHSILAITFTNKAANEMQERIHSQIGPIAERMWIGTFHAICAKMLRSCIEVLGCYSGNFNIYDTADSKAVIRECYKELDLNDKLLRMSVVQTVISSAKDSMLEPDMFRRVYKNDMRMQQIADVYDKYQDKLRRYNALDFDDIILNTIKVLSVSPETLARWQEQFKYIMVDEYQDTNNAQYMLISLLSEKHHNLCVVGDDDQSIYKFRGANIQNILSFENQFKDALVIRLEQNYRSTKNILAASNAVISNNVGRKGKELWTEHEEGEKLHVFKAHNEHDEGMFIARTVTRLKAQGVDFSDCAVLYRMNAQSRVIEEMLMRSGIPYRVLAGLRFYDRKEVKDCVAYLRAISNPEDTVSIQRIINVPKRGIGDTTIDKLMQTSAEANVSLMGVIENAKDYPELAKIAPKVKPFAELIQRLRRAEMEMSLTELVRYTLNESGYIAMCNESGDKTEIGRIENLEEFINVAEEFNREFEDNASLSDFLEKISLVSDIDNYDPDADSVALMTIHSAKGLEFENVFLPGMENGIFPSQQNIDDYEEMEEERRLCYVALTRAKKRLFISFADCRMLFGKTMYQGASVFLKEIPKQLMDLVSKSNRVSPYKHPSNNAPHQREEGYAGGGIPYSNSAPFGRSVKDFLNQQSYFKAAIKNENRVNRVIDSAPSSDINKVGTRVRHKVFGSGIIISSQPFGKDYKLQVQFDNGTLKTLMAAYANLEEE